MRIRFAVCLSAAMLPCLPAASPAQQPTPALKAPAREVVLTVTVRDKKGALVTSLRLSDFTLAEDSRPQTIRSFTRETSLPFRLGLLVDSRRSMSSAMDCERKAAGRFVDIMLPEKPSDRPSASLNQAFLIHFDREVELLEDFTTSRDRLHHDLGEMGPSRDEQNEARDSENGGNNNGGRGQGQGQRRGRRGGAQLYDAIYLASDELMKKQEGRKALVVFSDGVDRGSLMTLNDAVDAADRAGLTVYTIYFKSEQERSAGGGPPDGGGHRGGMDGGWNGGIGAGTGAAQQEEGPILYPKKPEVDGKKIMEKIAARTGGHFYEAKKKDTLEEIYGLIAEELRGQFLLTYTPVQVDKEGGFHKIALKANKDDLTVVTREGYYAPTEK
jgi:VWFA-related protein